MIIERRTLMYKNKVVFDKITFGAFYRMPKKFDETEACFMYLQEGSFQFRTPDKVIQVNTGEGVLAKCSDYFFEQKRTSPEKTTTTTIGFGIYLYPSIVKELFDVDLSVSDFETDYDATKVDIDELMKNFIMSIEFLLNNPQVSTHAMIRVKLVEFLLLLSNTENAPSVLDFVSALFKPYEYDFKRIIKQNIFSSLSISELSSLCSMSVSTFQRKFYDVYGQTPSKYILEQRMKEARRVLSEGDMPVSEIAYDCGYQSISTFNRVFKKTFGLSPSEFRLNENED